MPTALEEAKRIANEAAQLVETVEAEQATDTPGGQPTQYSSSVSTVDVADNGEITITMTLTPGPNPITPIPPTEAPVPGAPQVTGAPVPGGATPVDAEPPVDPGFKPAE